MSRSESDNKSSTQSGRIINIRYACDKSSESSSSEPDTDVPDDTSAEDSSEEKVEIVLQ